MHTCWAVVLGDAPCTGRHTVLHLPLLLPCACVQKAKARVEVLEAALQQQGEDWAAKQTSWQLAAAQQQDDCQVQLQLLQDQQQDMQSQLRSADNRADAAEGQLAEALQQLADAQGQMAVARAEHQQACNQLQAAEEELAAAHKQLRSQADSVDRWVAVCTLKAWLAHSMLVAFACRLALFSSNDPQTNEIWPC